MNMTELQTFADAYSAELCSLDATVQKLEAEIAAARRKYLGAIQQHVHRIGIAKSKLHHGVLSNAALFEKPRTQTFAGIKFGYQKQKGKILIADEESAIARLQTILGDVEAAKFLNVSVSVNKTAVNSLEADILKKAGIEISADSDIIIVKPVSSEIEKTVAAILASAEQTAIQQAA